MLPDGVEGEVLLTMSEETKKYANRETRWWVMGILYFEFLDSTHASNNKWQLFSVSNTHYSRWSSFFPSLIWTNRCSLFPDLCSFALVTLIYCHSAHHSLNILFCRLLHISYLSSPCHVTLFTPALRESLLTCCDSVSSHGNQLCLLHNSPDRAYICENFSEFNSLFDMLTAIFTLLLEESGIDYSLHWIWRTRD